MEDGWFWSPLGTGTCPSFIFALFKDMSGVLSKSLLFMFPVDSKCLRVINWVEDCVNSHSDLNNLHQWAAINHLDYQIPKCHNLRISTKRSVPQRTYGICRQMLETVTVERQLRVSYRQ